MLRCQNLININCFLNIRFTGTGALFREDQKDSFFDLAFKFAVHKINKDQYILPKTTLIYDIQYVKADDSFHANKQGDLFFHSIWRNRCLSISKTSYFPHLSSLFITCGMISCIISLFAIQKWIDNNCFIREGIKQSHPVYDEKFRCSSNPDTFRC